MDEVFDLVVRGKSKLIAAAVQEALDEGNAAPDGKGTDDGAASNYRKYRHHGQSGFLCKGFNKHIVKRFDVI